MMCSDRSPRWVLFALSLVLNGPFFAQQSAFAPLHERATSEILRSVPPNGSCSGATVVPVPMNTPVTVTGNNENAPTDPVFMANLVWEGFTITACADLTVSYCGTTPNFAGGLVYLVTGCPLTNLVFNGASNIIPNACGDGNFAIRFPSLPAGTYYYPVLEAPGSSGDYTLVFMAEPCAATPPANAFCSGALPLTASDECVFVSGTVEHATAAGTTGMACGNGDVSDGVWYSFVANSPSTEVIVQPSAEFNVHVSLLSGACGGHALLACAIGQNFGTATTLSATGLVRGDTYYLRVADWYAGIPRTSTFDICVVSLADSECEAAAGSLIPDAANVCYTGPSTTISAAPSGTAIVPPGSATLFLLLSATGVVRDVQEVPSFSAPSLGSFSIRTLVYDTATFDPQDIVPGHSTVGSLNELFVQGGGAICASLDLTGAGFTVENCCVATAGALTAVESRVCWDEQAPVTMAAQPSGNAVVPPGFGVMYLLSTGGVVADTASTPSFTVDARGTYRIHMLVYDPLTLPMDSIVPGTTTLDMLAAYFIAGGGALCGAVGHAGAVIEVVRCCPGAPGTLTLAQDTLCHTTAGATATWTLEGADVPAGYTVLFLVAAADGTILDTTSTSAYVLLDGPGTYHVHPLIHDSLTLDLSAVLVEGARLADLDALLVQGGGDVCALLDLDGAPVVVADCRPANDECSNPEFITVQLLETCAGNLIHGDNTHATQGGSAPSCGDAGSTYADVWYVFNTGENTGVTILLDPGTMTSWGIAVQDACDGTELLCEARPAAPVDLDTQAHTQLLVRIFSDLSVGQPGQFTMCVTGAVTSTICDGGSVTTSDGETALSICQDASADEIGFTTTSTAPVNHAYVVTTPDSTIVAMVAGGTLHFNDLVLGVYHVYGISFDGALTGAVVGAALADVSSTGQCIALSQDFVEVRVEVCSAVQEEAASGVMIWPNPGSGGFNLSLGQLEGAVEVVVAGADGRLVHAQRMTVLPGTVHRLDLPANVAPGMYVVRILADGSGHSVHRVQVR